MSLVIGVIAVAILWFALKAYVKIDPHTFGTTLKRLGGVLALVFASLLLVRGNITLALPVGYFGLWLFGYGNFGLAGLFGRTSKSTGMTSRVRSATIEMELNHDTGALRGRVLAGPREGADLDALDREALFVLHGQCLGNDQDGARLLEAYFDRRFAGWREDAERDGDPGSHGHAQSGPMTEQEAYEVLGLEAGADDGAVRGAHRSLMKRLHPDQGGSTYLAARVNQAKDILLARHR